LSVRRPGFIPFILLTALASSFLFLKLVTNFSPLYRSHFRRVSRSDFSGRPLTFDVFRKIATRANPAVVTVYAKARNKNSLKDLLGIAPGLNPFESNSRSRSVLGSGFVADPDGYIITNYHVVEDADQVEVSLSGSHDRTWPARVVKRDRKTDLVLIRIDVGKRLTSARLGDSTDLEVGDWVIAIGNPFNLDHTVTVGIVSAKGRTLGDEFADYIQTDASINPGNSGGPLLNLEGEVIGVNTAIYTRSGQSEGIGFAIPIDRARDLIH
jgi:S1-C subfamily serine protease